MRDYRIQCKNSMMLFPIYYLGIQALRIDLCGVLLFSYITYFDHSRGKIWYETKTIKETFSTGNGHLDPESTQDKYLNPLQNKSDMMPAEINIWDLRLRPKEFCSINEHWTRAIWIYKERAHTLYIILVVSNSHGVVQSNMAWDIVE